MTKIVVIRDNATYRRRVGFSINMFEEVILQNGNLEKTSIQAYLFSHMLVSYPVPIGDFHDGQKEVLY